MTHELQGLTQDLFLIAGSATLAFVIALGLTPWFTKQLIKLKIGKQIRENAMSGEKASIFAELHAKKAGTPTMGGLLIWPTVFLVVLISHILYKFGLFNQTLFNRQETWIPLFTLATCGLLGAVDDYFNIKGIGKTKGLSAKVKLLWLLIFAAVGAYWFYAKLDYTAISIPIPGVEAWEIGLWFVPLFMFVMIGTANAVNFTDGLDGLVSAPLIMAYGGFGVLAYNTGHLTLAALCAVIIGAILAFLWNNVPPAKFYMGDTGSLALGATLAVIAMFLDQTLVLPIIGFIFVIEALSVIIQLTSKKFFGRKVFRIAPIHHHFEHKGWKEWTVVMRFWIIAGIMATLGTIIGLLNLV